MIKNVVSNLGGIGLYGVLSICLFFTVFTGALIVALLKKAPYLNYMSTLPIADERQPEARGTLKGDFHHE